MTPLSYLLETINCRSVWLDMKSSRIASVGRREKKHIYFSGRLRDHKRKSLKHDTHSIEGNLSRFRIMTQKRAIFTFLSLSPVAQMNLPCRLHRSNCSSFTCAVFPIFLTYYTCSQRVESHRNFSDTLCDINPYQLKSWSTINPHLFIFIPM